MNVYNGYLEIDLVPIDLKSGGTAVREVMRTKDAVAVLCKVINTDVYLLVKQFRAPVNGEIVEVVAGGVEAGENPAVAAKREVEEELGNKVLSLSEQGWAWSSPGITTEKIHYFSAIVSAETFTQKLDPDEEVEVVPYTGEQLGKMLYNNRITDSKTMILAMKVIGC